MTPSERIKQAYSTTEDARLFERERMGNKAVITKYYHAMMHCLFALFNIREIGRMTHADIIDRFERECIWTEKIHGAILGVFRRAYDLTHECDCDHMPVPKDEEIKAARHAAEELAHAAGELLKKGDEAA
jgi:uncharacterized protein (UPF0332 family)